MPNAADVCDPDVGDILLSIEFRPQFLGFAIRESRIGRCSVRQCGD